MKKIKGLWFPDDERGKWLEGLPVLDGFPVYQADALNALLVASKRRRVAIDGGAHVGLWTLQLAKHFDHVLAFEPNNTALDCLQANLEEHGLSEKVTVFAAALGRINEAAFLYGDDTKSLSWSLKPSALEVGGLKKQPIFITNVDHHVKGKIDAIKLDVEGYQYEALLGAARSLLECQPVVLMEEKHDDPHWRATKLLTRIGMQTAGRWKRDFLFVYPDTGDKSEVG